MKRQWPWLPERHWWWVGWAPAGTRAMPFDRILGGAVSSRAKQESGVEITWLPTSENLFTRDGVLKGSGAAPDAGEFRSPDGGKRPHRAATARQQPPAAALYQEQHAADTATGTLAPSSPPSACSSGSLAWSSASSLWTMSNSSRFWASDFKVREGLNEFSFLPLSGGLSRGSRWQWPRGLPVAGHDGPLMRRARWIWPWRDLKGSADMAEISGIWLSPQRDDQLLALSLQLPESVKLSLQGGQHQHPTGGG